jgi:hypothetical protein
VEKKKRRRLTAPSLSGLSRRTIITTAEYEIISKTEEMTFYPIFIHTHKLTLQVKIPTGIFFGVDLV